jgi:L-histidine Nalpha-methyltransferase
MALLSAPTIALPLCQRLASVAREGLSRRQKSLPPWLFYDDAGSELFERITELPEYYLTRTERAIFACVAHEIVEQAAAGRKLRIAELGAGTAGKTQLLLAAALRRQRQMVYEPVDVSASALAEAQASIERMLPHVRVEPRQMDYTDGLLMDPAGPDEVRLVLYIGSSIGNFEPADAADLLARVREALEPGDCLLLGVDRVKDERILLAAYDDAAGVTAAFNRNVLVRLNRELDADFDPDGFVHVARWNEKASRVEMHLESKHAQTVRLGMLDLDLHCREGETIHTENSYKYAPGQMEAMLEAAGFRHEALWTDDDEWFGVHLARV